MHPSAHLSAIRQGLIVAVVLAQGVWIAAAQAQTFPAKPVRVVVPFPAGGDPHALREHDGHDQALTDGG